MAEIPVHKKSSLAWLWILLGLLLLGLLIWWIASAADDDEVVATPVATEEVAPVVPVEPLDNSMAGAAPSEAVAAAPASGPITDVSTLTADGLVNLVGRQVNLRNAPVTSVPNDMGFFIGSSAANRVFVVFEEVPSPNQPGKEGQVDVNNGSTVSVEGEIVRNDGPTMDAINASVPGGANAYIRASRVAVVNR